MRKMIIVVLVALAGLAGSSTLAAADLFSATRAVIAIVGGDLFIGDAIGHLSGAGSLAIHSQKDPALTCSGEFTSSVEFGGAGQLQCSDGRVATFQFTRLTTFTGHGTGTFGRNLMTFVYGLGYVDAVPYLSLPQGKKLIHNGVELALSDI
jgi:hypothetical protein